MYRRHGQKLRLAFLSCDLAVAVAAWFAAYAIRFALWPAPGGVPSLEHVARLLPLVLGCAAFAYWQCGLYEIHRLQRLPRELGVVLRASGLLFVLCITATFYLREFYESRLALGLFFVLNALLSTLCRRMVWRAVAWLRGRGLNRGRALIVGTGRTGRMVSETLRRNHWTGLETIGYADEPRSLEPDDAPRLGTISELAEIIRRHDVDHLFIALPRRRYAELEEIHRRISDAPVEVQFVPDVPDLAGMRPRIQEIDGAAFLSLRENPLVGWSQTAKRAMDLLLATTALIVFSPLMAALAIIVKISSPGPILYRQTRSGLDGLPFEMLKFRTMAANAEQSTGPVWAVRDDHRRTWLGCWMRRLNLDELPQLFNVLAGHMSLVGPRPERPVFVERFRKEIPNYAWRHRVKAGLTGWAQVNGWRGNTSLRRRVEHDLYYINHWSIGLDLKILFLTVLRGFRDPNAY
ncbi:MAG: undecaprenyl-phosphate glucose phosphotransferase [Planctomycetales bacterium]